MDSAHLPLAWLYSSHLRPFGKTCSVSRAAAGALILLVFEGVGMAPGDSQLLGQVLISDDMESYTTATPTSATGGLTANPSYWWTYSGNGASATGGVSLDGVGNTRGAVLSADFTGASGGGVAQLGAPGYPTAANSGHTLSDFQYSFTLKGSEAQAVTVMFSDGDASYSGMGTLQKDFTLSAGGAFQTFSGNLAEGGWTPNTAWFGGAVLTTDAAHYAWAIGYGAWYWGTDAPNRVVMDNMLLQAVPEPAAAAMVAGVALLAFGFCRRCRPR